MSEEQEKWASDKVHQVLVLYKMILDELDSYDSSNNNYNGIAAAILASIIVDSIRYKPFMTI